MIATVTMNASVDKLYRVGRLEPGRVIRVDEVRNTAGGKGLNVARVLSVLGAEVLALGVVGGRNGAFIRESLDRAGIAHDLTESGVESRCCLNIVDASTGLQTELLEPGPRVPEEAVDDLMARFSSVCPRCRVVAVSGSLPPGVPAEFYLGLVAVGRGCGASIILDTGGVGLKAALPAKPDVIKHNLEELGELVGRPVSGRDDVLEAAGRLVAGGVGLAVVSMGPEGALFYSRDEIFAAAPPKIDPVNTVGCGDSLVAGLAFGLYERRTLEETARLAIAVSAAGAMAQETGGLDPAVLETTLPLVTVTRLA